MTIDLLFVALDYSSIVGNSSTVARLLDSNDVNYLTVLARSIRDRANLYGFQLLLGVGTFIEFYLKLIIYITNPEDPKRLVT